MACPDVSNLAATAPIDPAFPGRRNRRQAGSERPRWSGMPEMILKERARSDTLLEAPRSSSPAAAEPQALRPELMSPNAFVRWAFYLSAFSIPFMCVYVPGTGERVGVLRLV